MDMCVKIAERCLGIEDPDLRYMFFNPRRFSGGEYCPKFQLPPSGNLRGKSVYLIMTPGPYQSPEELVGRAQIAARAAKEHNADNVVLLATDMPHARQDRGVDEVEKARGEANTSALHASTFRAAGIDQVITAHAHTPRLAAFYAREYGLLPPELAERFDPNDPRAQEAGNRVLKAIPLQAFVADYLLHNSWLASTEEGRRYIMDGGIGIVLKAMDKGNRGFMDDLHKAMFLPNVSIIYCKKARQKKNDPDSVEVEIEQTSGNFSTLDGKVEIYADDGMDSAGTMMKAAKWSSEGNVCAEKGTRYGTPAGRIVYFSHPWLGGNGHKAVQERIFHNLPAIEFVTTNSRPYIDSDQHHRFKRKSTVLRLAALYADAIIANELGIDISERYSGFASEEEQHVFISELYRLKRHSQHFMTGERAHEAREIKFALRD
jgi:phosphoribosylpyrophosphate synthetase